MARWRVSGLVMLFTVSAMVLTACGPGGGPPPMPPAPVTVLDVRPEDIPMTFVHAGRASDAQRVEVRARVTGILVRRAYIEGARVKRGDLLFVIDPAPLRAQSNAATAGLAQARAAATQAENDAARAEEIFAKQLISSREHDLAISNRDQARAALARAQAEADRAAIDLGYTRVTAPISGVTSIGTRPEGSYVSPQKEESLLTTITPIDPIFVDFSVSESDNARRRELMAAGRLTGPARGTGKATLRLDDGTVYAQPGKVEYLDVVIDPQTGTLLGRAVFPNADATLLPGQFVRVALEGYTLRAAIRVPEKAVQESPAGSFVYVVNDKTQAEMRPVKLGLPVGNDRVVDAGLAAGDRVIIDNLMKIYPGSAVQIAPAATDAASKNAAPQAAVP